LNKIIKIKQSAGIEQVAKSRHWTSCNAKQNCKTKSMTCIIQYQL